MNIKSNSQQTEPSPAINICAIKVIYKYEMLRAWATMLQSFISPVISTALYFVVFGSAIGSRIQEIDGVSYGTFIVPGLIMLALLTQSIANASFGIFFPKFTGTIYEVMSAPISFVEILISLAKSKIYDINGNRRDEEYQELATLFHNANIHILIDRNFEEQIDNISNELITFLLINGNIDKVIYLVGVTNNYNTFNSYRL